MKILRMNKTAQVERGLSLRLMSGVLHLKRPAKSKAEFETITVTGLHGNSDQMLVELRNDKDIVNRLATCQELFKWLWEDGYELDVGEYEVSLTSDHVAIRIDWNDDILLMFYLSDKVWRALPKMFVDAEEVLWIAEHLPQTKRGTVR